MGNPKIGLALGSGGARGFAHLGVLKVLTDANIPIDYIAGSSMGALIGSFYCSGHSMEHLYKLATTFRRKYYLDFSVPKMGFISGKKIKEFIKLFTHGKKIEELNIPLAIVATDLLTGEKVIFREGLLPEAVRASISIPGIFIPERIEGRLLVDGGVVDRVPVSVVKEMGADIVIAVDCAHFKENTEITSIFDVIMQSIDIMQDELVRQRAINTDILLRPRVEHYSARAFKDIEEIIKIGEQETLQSLSSITNAIDKWKENHND